jgi:hypothetical protein
MGSLRFSGCDQCIDLFIRSTDLESPSADAGMPGHKLSRVVQIPGFKEQNTANLLLGLCVGTIGDDNLPASTSYSCCIPSWLKRFSPQKMSAPTKLVVVRKALLQEGFAFAFGHPGPVGVIEESKANESHGGHLALGETALPTNSSFGNGCIRHSWEKFPMMHAS